MNETKMTIVMSKSNGQISDWSECDSVLLTLRLSDADAEAVQAERKAQLAEAAAPFDRQLDDIAKSRKPVEAMIRAWLRKRKRHDFTDVRLKQLDNGVVGFRLGQQRVDLLTKAKTWAVALVKVSANIPRYVRIIRELAKDLILQDYKAGKLTDQDLAAWDLRIVQAERIVIEPKADPTRDRNGES